MSDCTGTTEPSCPTLYRAVSSSIWRGLRSGMTGGLGALVLLTMAVQTLSHPAGQWFPQLVSVTMRPVGPSSVLRDGANAPAAQQPSTTHPCEVTLRLESGAILPVFLKVVERGGKLAARPENVVCPETRGVRLRLVRHRAPPHTGPILSL